MSVLADPSAGQAATPDPSVWHGCIPQINPATGLSTDYLNHFTEAVMVIAMLPTAPECVVDLMAWQPKSYVEHFEQSSFTDRDKIIAAYHGAPAEVRDGLERVSETLNTLLASTRDVMIQCVDAPNIGELTERALYWLNPLVERTAGVITGTARGSDAESATAQGAVDILFTR
jgi:hypothetical protein